MECNKYLELLSARLDGALTPEEARELEEHLSRCPECRAAGAQLAALQSAFRDLEDVPPPEGFAQGVMGRIRREEKKVIPLFRRPQVRALAGLAACLALAVGLYGASRPQKTDRTDIMLRSFSQDASLEMADTPQITAYAAPEAAPCNGAKMPGSSDLEAVETLPAERLSDSAVLVLDRMPQGAEELIPPETAVTFSPDTGEEGYRWLDVQGEPETLARIEQLALEQAIPSSRSAEPLENMRYDLVILQPNH